MCDCDRCNNSNLLINIIVGLLEQLRKRDFSLDALTAERDDLSNQAHWLSCERESLTFERDALQSRVERLGRLNLDMESRLDALATREPTLDELKEMRGHFTEITPTLMLVLFYRVRELLLGPDAREGGRE